MRAHTYSMLRPGLRATFLLLLSYVLVGMAETTTTVMATTTPAPSGERMLAPLQTRA